MIMKKLLSLLLVLGLLLGIAGCAASGNSMQLQTEPSVQSGTTEPLFWPPLPTETELSTEPTQESTTPTEPEQPIETQAVSKPEKDPIEATYYPRDDEDQPSREETTAPVFTEPESQPQATNPPAPQPTEPSRTLDPNGTYDSKNDVALFIHLYGRLPNNFITKSQAKSLGWQSGSLERYAPGKCIGGDRFYNKEGRLPPGHTYYECDIETLGASSRGAQRIVYSTDGLIYYTYNHYQTFTLLYGTP